MEQQTKDRTPFQNLLALLKPAIFNVPQILKNFIKERHYLHFLYTILGVSLLSLVLDTKGFPTHESYNIVENILGVVGVILIGWILGYLPNYAWEWWFARKGKEKKDPIKFDINDVFSGSYAGVITFTIITILKNIYVY